MKKKLISIMLTSSFIIAAISLQGQALAYESTAAKVKQGVSFRDKPSLSGDRIRYLKKGESVTVVDKINSYWYKIKDSNNKVGYVSTSDKYLEVTGNTPADGKTNAEVVYGVSFRKGPSTDEDRIRYLKKGERVLVIDKVNNYWYKIKDEKGTVGYVSTNSKYLDTSYDDGLDNSGPEDVINPSETISKVILTGKKYLGTPYEFGSSRSNTRTFDCSDFVRQAYLEGADIRLPADSRQQGQYVREKGEVKTDWRDLKPGDLMFFMSYKGNKDSDYNDVDKFDERITHDGIYLGNGKILHTYSKESGGVRIDNIEGTNWERRFLYGGSVVK